MTPSGSPIGALLAGGMGRRIGGEKATVQLGGSPLVAYPLSALNACLHEVAIVAKASTQLPRPPGAPVWIEPDAPRHPLTGIRHALERAGGRPVLICAADMPCVTPELVRWIIATAPDGAPAVVPSCDGVLQPLLALYLPGALTALSGAAQDGALRDAVAAIGPKRVEIEDRDAFFNVNTREDLGRAAAILARRRPAPEEGINRR